MKRDGLFYKKLFSLVLPVAMQNLLAALVSASDALMLGFLDQDSLSAVSLAAQIQFVQNLFLASLTIGATILAAQYWGNKDSESVEKVLAAALKASLPVSMAFWGAALFAPGALMHIFTADKRLIELGIPYLRIVSWSYLFMGFSQIYLCIMKNSGRVLKSTVYGSAAVLLNILLNAVLIFGLAGFPKMGITGAATATVLARAAELLAVIYENGRKDTVRIRLSVLIKPDRQLEKDFRRYTGPVLGNELVWGCGFTMFTIIMGHMGSDAVAANSIANIVKNLIACLCMGIGTGSGIIVGNELGSSHTERAKEYGGKLCKISLTAGVISGAILLLCIPAILCFASGLNARAVSYLKGMLLICSYYLIGKSVNSTVIAGIFCAGGDTKFGFLCDFVTMWLIVVPVGFLAAFVLRLPVLAVYFLLNLDELIKIPAVYVHYKKYGWLKNLTEKESKKGAYEK